MFIVAKWKTSSRFHCLSQHKFHLYGIWYDFRVNCRNVYVFSYLSRYRIFRCSGYQMKFSDIFVDWTILYLTFGNGDRKKKSISVVFTLFECRNDKVKMSITTCKMIFRNVMHSVHADAHAHTPQLNFNNISIDSFSFLFFSLPSFWSIWFLYFISFYLSITIKWIFDHVLEDSNFAWPQQKKNND